MSKKDDKFNAAKAKRLNKLFDMKIILPRARKNVETKLLPEIREAAAEGKNFAQFIFYTHKDGGREYKECERDAKVEAEFCCKLLTQLGFKTSCFKEPWTSETDFSIQSGWELILKVEW